MYLLSQTRHFKALCCIQEPLRALHKHTLLISPQYFNCESASCQQVHLHSGCRSMVGFSVLLATSPRRPCLGPLWGSGAWESQLRILGAGTEPCHLKHSCCGMSSFLASSPVLVTSPVESDYNMVGPKGLWRLMTAFSSAGRSENSNPARSPTQSRAGLRPEHAGSFWIT